MEFFDYRRVNIDTSVVVDRSRGEKLTVHLNVTYPRVPCYRECTAPMCSRRPTILTTNLGKVLSLDIIDISGELQRDITHNIVKTRLTEEGVSVRGSQVAELRNDIDKLNEQRASGYCGSCYGGEPPEGGCCNSCDSVREAYVRKGWSFGNPSAIEQVRYPPL